jgi:hypothetical protein
MGEYSQLFGGVFSMNLTNDNSAPCLPWILNCCKPYEYAFGGLLTCIP